jgi:tetratricopeptide (TPR) repeat protein
MRALTIGFLCLVLAGRIVFAAAEPVRANAATPGFVPPVLTGLQKSGSGRRADRPIPFPGERERWVMARSEHFVVISAAGERRTRELLQNVEILAAALAELHPRFERESSDRTRLFLFGPRRDSQPYFDLLLKQEHSRATGMFVKETNGSGVMILDGSYDRHRDRTPYHELVHDLLSRSSVQTPLWLDEGLAEYFSNAEVGRKAIRAGMPIAEHVAAMRRHTPMPLRDLFSVNTDSDLYNLPSGQEVFYPESWAAVDWMMRMSGPKHQAFYDFLHDVESGVAPADALQSRFHRSIRDLQYGIDAYASVLSAPSTTFSTWLPVSDARSEVTIEPLARADVLFELGRLLARVDDGGVEAERHFRAALLLNPKHARSYAALAAMRLAADKQKEAAALFEQAITADPKDTTIRLDYAEALMGTAIGELAETSSVDESRAEPFRHARALAREALDLGGDRGRSLGIIGSSYIVEPEAVAAGLTALREAHQLLPARTDFALHLCALELRAGDRAAGEALFHSLAASHDKQVAFAARVLMMRNEVHRANELADREELAEAASVLRSLAANTTDADTRGDFERQAAQMDSVAATNHQIEHYNSAVGLVNAGKYQSAMQALDKLLASATDPGVIRDAKHLQGSLKKRK